eukprot:CAMPEP_0116135974 /NCGR_PEP_ID=MMETSP0329-20121206/11475_1 /TAXON_ID=697910 /ORGANISM="Pseudo-nitzschia arenysensis, Strain B593" /LENGTH=817 /DNA_ID=CAMNT_0003630807 /DNA_START=125 /DNA_END=2578 /DNA_ORIENTATION=+
MVRRGSRRSSATKDGSVSDSPTQPSMELKQGQTNPRRVRGSSPVNTHRSKPLVRPRRSKRGSSGYLSNPWTDGVDHSDNDNPQYSTPQHSTLDMVPSHWTTESGKFDPRQSEMSFDARSNAAINLNMRHSRNYNRNNDEKSLDSEDTNGNSSEDSPKNTKKAKKKDAPRDGEIEDPTERHQFYKKLKKAGIKKTFVIEDDWETNSNNSAVSEISVGNASYILDLAQQKESRKKDREEEALEEALELYGTWLTEGKNDDKNIFLMILHEVKKEQKARCKKHDKKHAALLNAALDDELKRREQIKQEEIEREEEEERVKAEKAKKKEVQAKMIASSPKSPPKQRKSVSRRKSFHTIQCETMISEIITSQQSMEEEEGREKDSCDDSNDSGNFPVDWPEPFEPPDSADVEDDDHVDEILEPSKPKSSGSRHLQMFGSKRNLATSSSKSDLDRGSFHKRKSDLDRKSLHKQSMGIFSRLRRQLSERQAEQWKESETSWRANSHVVTDEEKWWNKINEAKKERVLFSQQKAMLDQTSTTLPTPQSRGMAKLDFSTRSDPGTSDEMSVPETPAPKKAAQALDESHTSTTVSAKTNGSADLDKKAVSPKKKKTAAKDLDLTESSNEQTPEKKKKKKTEKPSKSKHRRSSATGAMFTPDLDATKSPKPKDKKKKKKAKSLDSSGIEGVMALKDNDGPSKKKKERYSRYEGTDDDTRSVGSSKSTASSKSLKKKKSKGSKARNSLEMSPRKTKKKSKSFDSTEVQSVTKNGKKKKSKKKSHASVGSSSDDLYSDDASLDWTDRCISASPSNETGAGGTVLTSDSAY